jgi:hypothetical protein
MAKHYTLRFDDTVQERFYKYCDEHFISKNKLINSLIKEYLDNIESKDKLNKNKHGSINT